MNNGWPFSLRNDEQNRQFFVVVVRTSQSRYINNALFHSINIFFFIPWCSCSFMISGVWNLSNLIQCQVSWPVKQASPLKSRSSVIVFSLSMSQGPTCWHLKPRMLSSMITAVWVEGTRHKNTMVLNKSNNAAIEEASTCFFFRCSWSWSNNLEIPSWLALYFLVSIEPMRWKLRDSMVHRVLTLTKKAESESKALSIHYLAGDFLSLLATEGHGFVR